MTKELKAKEMATINNCDAVVEIRYTPEKGAFALFNFAKDTDFSKAYPAGANPEITNLVIAADVMQAAIANDTGKVAIIMVNAVMPRIFECFKQLKQNNGSVEGALTSITANKQWIRENEEHASALYNFLTQLVNLSQSETTSISFVKRSQLKQWDAINNGEMLEVGTTVDVVNGVIDGVVQLETTALNQSNLKVVERVEKRSGQDVVIKGVERKLSDRMANALRTTNKLLNKELPRVIKHAETMNDAF